MSLYLCHGYTYLRNPIIRLIGLAQEELKNYFPLYCADLSKIYSTLNPISLFERLESLRLSSEPQIRTDSINCKGLFVKVGSSCASCAEH